MRFTNKTVFITGAAGGIGRQTGLSFAKEGANVAVSDLDFDMASRVAKEIKSAGGNAEPFKLDVTNQNETIENMKNAYEHFGSLDIAFCNAGIREIVSPLELSIEEWRKVIDINVTGVFITAQTFAKHCIDKKIKGNIVITSSTLASICSLVILITSANENVVINKKQINFTKTLINIINCLTIRSIQHPITN